MWETGQEKAARGRLSVFATYLRLFRNFASLDLELRRFVGLGQVRTKQFFGRVLVDSWIEMGTFLHLPPGPAPSSLPLRGPNPRHRTRTPRGARPAPMVQNCHFGAPHCV